jgi:FAD:protein FMN transferase
VRSIRHWARSSTCGAVEQAPEDEAVTAALSAAGWRRLKFDSATRRLTQPGGLRLDLAGIAKGFAVDRFVQLLRDTGATAALVEIGGEVRGFGVKPDAQPWWVEIERPPHCATAPMVAALYNLAVATSGDYRRFAWRAGRRISHTIDPRSGLPLHTSIAAVSVLHADCMHADAYATALMTMGVEAGLAFANAHNIAAIFTLGGASGAEERLSDAFARGLA